MKNVAVWGKFEGLHKGHIEFLKHARDLGDQLYVVILPDKILRGHKSIVNREAEERRQDILGLEFVSEVYIDSLCEGLSSILELKPDIFALGHDQKTQWEKKLKQYLSSKGLHPEYVYLGIYNNGIHANDLKR